MVCELVRKNRYLSLLGYLIENDRLNDRLKLGNHLVHEWIKYVTFHGHGGSNVQPGEGRQKSMAVSIMNYQIYI